MYYIYRDIFKKCNAKIRALLPEFRETIIMKKLGVLDSSLNLTGKV